jgi:hypothetical protein
MSSEPATSANLVQKPRRSRKPRIASAAGSTSPNTWTLQAGSGVFRNMGTIESANVVGPATIRDTPCMQMLSPSVSRSSRNASAGPRRRDFLGEFMFFSLRPSVPVLYGPIRLFEPWRGIRLQYGAKNRIRLGLRRGVLTNSRKSRSPNLMRAVAASVTIDALVAPMGCIQNSAGRPCHELFNSDSYREIHQAGKRHLRMYGAFCGRDALLRPASLPAMRPPPEIQIAQTGFLSPDATIAMRRRKWV